MLVGNREGFPQYCTISGYKFNDLDRDGVWDKPGEPGLAGWTIELTYPNGDTITTTTNADGYYEFTGLPDGTYTVREIPQSGWVQSCPAAYSFKTSKKRS